MGAIAPHLERAAAAHRQLQAASAALVLYAAAAHYGVDRAELFRDTRWPTPSAKARALAIYLLTTSFGFEQRDAAAAIGVSGHRKSVWRYATIVADERDRDQALDKFCDDIGRLIEGRRAA